MGKKRIPLQETQQEDEEQTDPISLTEKLKK